MTFKTLLETIAVLAIRLTKVTNELHTILGEVATIPPRVAKDDPTFFEEHVGDGEPYVKETLRGSSHTFLQQVLMLEHIMASLRKEFQEVEPKSIPSEQANEPQRSVVTREEYAKGLDAIPVDKLAL